MSKIIYRAKPTDKGPREPQMWYAFILRDGSRVERDGTVWTLWRPTYLFSWVDMLAGTTSYGWQGE